MQVFLGKKLFTAKLSRLWTILPLNKYAVANSEKVLEKHKIIYLGLACFELCRFAFLYFSVSFVLYVTVCLFGMCFVLPCCS